VEQLGPAEIKLAEIYRKIHARRILGVQELDAWSGGQLLPTSTAFGRVIRFLGKVHDPSKGVLGVDIGASSTTVATSFSDKLKLNVYPQLGMGEGLTGLLNSTKLEEITRWIPLEVDNGYVLDYLYNKTLYPATLPATPEDLAIEQSVAREAIRRAVRLTERSYPRNVNRCALPDTLPWFDPILVGGSVIAKAPTAAQGLLMILDAIEPTGVTRLILDKNGLAQALGAAAAFNPILAVQILESNSFLNLGYVIAPVGKARRGTSVLRLKIMYDTGQEFTYDIKQGMLQLIPLPAGRVAQLHLHPLQRFDIGLGGPGKSGGVKVIGGAFGLIVDARGRPLHIPAAPERRREMLRKWHWALLK
jgi:hypothetical protein